MSGKQSWPELVGKPVDEAVNTIKRENPNLNVSKVAATSPVTADLRNDRVRVFYDQNNKVSIEPNIG